MRAAPRNPKAYRNFPRITRYEVVIDNDGTETRQAYSHDEYEMASASFWRAQTSGTTALTFPE